MHLTTDQFLFAAEIVAFIAIGLIMVSSGWMILRMAGIVKDPTTKKPDQPNP